MNCCNLRINPSASDTGVFVDSAFLRNDLDTILAVRVAWHRQELVSCATRVRPDILLLQVAFLWLLLASLLAVANPLNLLFTTFLPHFALILIFFVVSLPEYNKAIEI